MTMSLRTIVTFLSSTFNTSEPKEYFINECCFGDDVARWLIERLRSRGFETDGEPGQEDFGWWLGFRAGDVNHQLVLGYRPADGDEPGIWIGWFERRAGCLGSLLGLRTRGIRQEAVGAVHAVLVSSPEVSHVRWHRREDFDAGREERGEADPTIA